MANENFWSKVDQSGDCWLWTGYRLKPRKKSWRSGNYGQFSGKLAHRVAYESANGPIPTGLTIDHLCNNPPCVNPAHLEAVTLQENMRRWADSITHCPQGHAYDEANTYRNARGSRFCRACGRAATAAYKKRKRARLMSETCKVTLTTGAFRNGRGYTAPKCGEPVVRDELCDRHLADRERLREVL